MVSKVFEHPFDLTKVRLQAQVLDATARFSGPIDCLRKTWTNEGFTGLYRGLPAPIVGAMVENASLFLGYSELQNLIRRTTARPIDEPLPLHLIALAAAGAGGMTSFLLTPIELVKCKMQVQMLLPPSVTPTKPPGPISVLMTAVRTTGLTGLWRGHTGTFIRETGGTAAWFSTKEFVAGVLVRRRLGEDYGTVHGGQAGEGGAVSDNGNGGGGGHGGSSHKLELWESGLSGACAGAAFNLAFFPADSVKSMMQTEDELRGARSSPPSSFPSSSSPNHSNVSPLSKPYSSSPAPSSATINALPKSTFLSTARAMYAAQGIRGLYAGCGITVARSIPSSAIIFLIYDGLVGRFG